MNRSLSSCLDLPLVMRSRNIKEKMDMCTDYPGCKDIHTDNCHVFFVMASSHQTWMKAAIMKPFCTKPLLVYFICHLSSIFPSSSPNLTPPPFPLHHFSHLRLTPPHSLRCLRSDSYVLVERGLLLICAEWEKAVLAWGGEKLV